jgi:hypothetical protein
MILNSYLLQRAKIQNQYYKNNRELKPLVPKTPLYQTVFADVLKKPVKEVKKVSVSESDFVMVMGKDLKDTDVENTSDTPPEKDSSIESETEEKSEIKQIIVNVDETTKKELEASESVKTPSPEEKVVEQKPALAEEPALVEEPVVEDKDLSEDEEYGKPEAPLKGGADTKNIVVSFF